MKKQNFSSRQPPLILMLVFAQALIIQTKVSIVGDQCYSNGELTHIDRTWNSHRIEGLF